MRNKKEIRHVKGLKFVDNIWIGRQYSWKCDGVKFLVVVSQDETHEHVSISHKNKEVYPTFDQMVKLKEIFFYEDEVVKLYMKKNKKEGLVQNCFHIFRNLSTKESA